MARMQSAAEDEILKRHGRTADSYRSVDLTQAVMERIRDRSNDGHRPARRSQRPVRRSAMAAALGAVILFGSLTGYAATEYLQVRNAKGQTVIQTVKPSPYSLPPAISRQFAEYSDRVRASLQPGQMLAYYINDDQLNAYDRANPIKFESQLQYSSYADYVDEMKRVAAPLLERPGYLPAGYVFKQGQIFPRPPLRGDADPTAYDRLEEKLLARAAAAPQGSDKLFVEPVAWTGTLGANLAFSNGSIVLNLLATNGPDRPEEGGKATVPQSAAAQSETVVISGQEALYMRDERPDAATPNLVTWYDEKSNVYYEIMDSPGSRLTRQDMLNIAASMMAQTQK